MKASLEPLAQSPIDSPRLTRIGRKEDHEQQNQRDGIELCTKVAPQRDAVTCAPPARQSQVQHKERADDGTRPHEKAEDHRNGNPEFEHPDEVSEEDRVRRHQVGKHSTVEPNSFRLNISRQIFLKIPMRERRAGNFVLAEEEEQNSGSDAGNSDGLPTGGFSRHSQDNKRLGGWDALPGVGETPALPAGPIIAHVLLEGIQFLRQPIDPPLKQISNRQHPQ